MKFYNLSVKNFINNKKITKKKKLMLLKEFLFEKETKPDVDEEVEKLSHIDNPIYVLHFTNLKKLGVNPLPGYTTTPYGLYGYPIKYTYPKYKSFFNYPFANERAYVFVFSISPDAEILEYNNKIPIEYVEKLKNYYENIKEKIEKKVENNKNLSQMKEELEEIFNNSKNEKYVDNDTFYKIYISMVKLLSEGNESAIQTFLLRKILNVDVLLDPGFKFIHQNEPSQLVVVNPKVVENVKLYSNPVFSVIGKSENEALQTVFSSNEEFYREAVNSLFFFFEKSSFEEKKQYFDYFFKFFIQFLQMPENLEKLEKQAENIFHFVKSTNNIFDFYLKLTEAKSTLAEYMKELVKFMILYSNYLKEEHGNLNSEEKIYEKLMEFLNSLLSKNKIEEFFDTKEKYFSKFAEKSGASQKNIDENVVKNIILNKYFAEFSEKYPNVAFYLLEKYSKLIEEKTKDMNLYMASLFYKIFQNIYESNKIKALELFWKLILKPNISEKFAKPIVFSMKYLFDNEVFKNNKASMPDSMFLPFVVSGNMKRFMEKYNTEEKLKEVSEKFGISPKHYIKIAEIFFSNLD